METAEMNDEPLMPTGKTQRELRDAGFIEQK